MQNNINRILYEALIRIKDEHGVIIGNLEVDWIRTTTLDGTNFADIQEIHTANSEFVDTSK